MDIKSNNTEINIGLFIPFKQGALSYMTDKQLSFVSNKDGWTTKLIVLDSVISNQSTITIGGLAAKVQGFYNPPKIVQFKGKNYIWDGNHSLIYKMLQGHQCLRCEFKNVDLL